MILGAYLPDALERVCVSIKIDGPTAASGD